MLLFEIDMIGGPCDGWRAHVAATPGRELRVRTKSGNPEMLAPGDVPADGRVAEYQFREVASLSPVGPNVALRYDFCRYIPRERSAAPYNHRRPEANVPAASRFWRRLLASARRWLLAPVDYLGSTRNLQ